MRIAGYATLLAVSLLLLAVTLSSYPVISQNSEQTNLPVIGSKVLVATVYGVIDPATEQYIDHVITMGENTNSMVILLLNTPGGLLDSAMNIVIRIDKASVPVVGFVVDKWAESAGTLILVSTHVAAMQPGTVIGSLQPIEYEPTSGTYKPVNESKIINPIIKFMIEHAKDKGRNITALELFVRQNLNLGADEALKYHVINYIANDVGDLLRKMNGTTVYLPKKGIRYLVVTDNAEIRYLSQPLNLQVAHALSDPMLTSLFMTLGLAIVLFTVIAGHFSISVVGLLLILLGLVGSGYSINVTSIALLALGFILLFIELFVTPGFGVVGTTGIIMLVLGIALFPVSTSYSFSIQYAKTFIYVAYSLGGIFGGLTAVAVYKIIQVKRKKPLIWSIVGQEGKATDPISGDKEGFVIVSGEYWKALSTGEEINPGDRVVVVEKRGPILIVKRKETVEKHEP